MLVWQLKKSFSFKGNYWTKPSLRTFFGTAEHFQIKRGKAFADISKKNCIKKGSTGHQVQSGSPANCQSPDCPETGHFPSGTHQTLKDRNKLNKFKKLIIKKKK